MLAKPFKLWYNGIVIKINFQRKATSELYGFVARRYEWHHEVPVSVCDKHS